MQLNLTGLIYVLAAVLLSSTNSNSQDAQPVKPQDSAIVVEPRLAVLGNDAESLHEYCVFQNQIYSPGVTFCTGVKLRIECRRQGNASAFWTSDVNAGQCATFK
jgi:hypothetical protein